MAKKALSPEIEEDSLTAKRRLSHWKPGWRWLLKRIENHRERRLVKAALKNIRDQKQ